MKPDYRLILKKVATSGCAMLLAMPASGSYKLKGYGFGSGGEDNATSSNYAINGVSGEQSGPQGSSGLFKIFSGLIPTQNANVPGAPTFTNPSDYYNKLHFVVNTSDNPTDTKYALAISMDNFATTQYVQSDHSIGSALGSEDYQTFSAWGGSNGENVIGLKANTIYYLKAKAYHGKFSETGYGPVASASTAPPSLDFAIHTDTQMVPPYSIVFSDLTAGSVISSPEKIWAEFATNAEMGGRVYISNDSSGLKSTAENYTIPAITGDISVQSEGYGAQTFSTNQTSGGPFQSVAPYDGVGQNVGVIDTAIRELFSSAGPVVGGSGSILLKAKSSSITPAATDYRSVLTIIASASF